MASATMAGRGSARSCRASCSEGPATGLRRLEIPRGRSHGAELGEPAHPSQHSHKIPSINAGRDWTSALDE